MSDRDAFQDGREQGWRDKERECEKLKAEINRLEDVKRRALDIANERSKENVELRAELEEQARLNGMGAQRELALRAELIRLRADKEAEIVRLQTDQAAWVKETLRAHEELEAENERLRQERDSQVPAGQLIADKRRALAIADKRDAENAKLREALTEIVNFSVSVPWHMAAGEFRGIARKALKRAETDPNKNTSGDT